MEFQTVGSDNTEQIITLREDNLSINGLTRYELIPLVDEGIKLELNKQKAIA